MRTSRDRSRVVGIALLASTALLASCGGGDSDDGKGSSDPTTTEAADLSILGTPKAAAGDPVTIGYITDGSTATIDGEGEQAAAAAAVEYVNEYLGGIGGRPLELKKCLSKVTPAGAADCANEMIAEGMPLVLGTTPAAPVPITTALEGAGIPYFVHTTPDQSTIFSKNTSVLTNAIGFIAAPVQIAVDEGYKSVATILIDVPAAVGPIKALSDPAYEKFGIKNTFAVVPPGTPDMTPQIQAALAEDPEMFTIVGDVNFCTAGLNALSTLGFTGTKFINYQCFSPDLATSVAGGIDGVKVGATQSLDPKDSEVQLYDAVMTKYAPDTEPFGATTSGGYSIVMAAARALSTTTGDLTPEVVKNAFSTVGPQPMPLMSGQTFQCDRSLYVLTPSVCSTGLVIVTLDGDGVATKSVQVDTKKIFPDA